MFPLKSDPDVLSRTIRTQRIITLLDDTDAFSCARQAQPVSERGDGCVALTLPGLVAGRIDY